MKVFIVVKYLSDKTFVDRKLFIKHTFFNLVVILVNYY